MRSHATTMLVTRKLTFAGCHSKATHFQAQADRNINFYNKQLTDVWHQMMMRSSTRHRGQAWVDGQVKALIRREEILKILNT